MLDRQTVERHVDETRVVVLLFQVGGVVDGAACFGDLASVERYALLVKGDENVHRFARREYLPVGESYLEEVVPAPHPGLVILV